MILRMTLKHRHLRKSQVQSTLKPNLPFLKTSDQPTSTTNQTIQLAPKQFLDFIRQFTTQDNQQKTISPTPYCLQGASTRTLSLVVRRTNYISLFRRLSNLATVLKTI